MVLAELPNLGRYQRALLPQQDTLLPSDLGSLRENMAESISVAQVSTFRGEDISGFGRQLQAVFLLNEAIQLTRHEPRSNNRISGIENIDSAAKDLLALLMEEKRQWTAVRDASVVIVIRCAVSLAYMSLRRVQLLRLIHARTLFILHESYLAEASVFCSKVDVERSHNTLRTITMMMLDTARCQNQGKPFHHALPLCCAANMKSAKDYIAQIKFKNELDFDDNVLDNLVDSFCSIWRCGKSF